MRERLLAGDACDAFVSTAAMLDSLEQDGRVIAGTVRTLGRVRTGIAVRAGEPLADVSTGDALAARLREAPAIYVPDTERATAGIHFVRVLDRLGCSRRSPRSCAPTRTARSRCNGSRRTVRRARSAARRRPRSCTRAASSSRASCRTSSSSRRPTRPGVCASAADAELASTFVAWIAGDRAAALRRAGGFEG
jgi:molybdate transport system substrate-binding protein